MSVGEKVIEKKKRKNTVPVGKESWDGVGGKKNKERKTEWEQAERSAVRWLAAAAGERGVESVFLIGGSLLGTGGAPPAAYGLYLVPVSVSTAYHTW